jgi:hypothetical protein
LRQALALILGCVPLLVVAALIEGFISPNESIFWPVKWRLGLLTGALLSRKLLLAGWGVGQPHKINVSIQSASGAG